MTWSRSGRYLALIEEGSYEDLNGSRRTYGTFKVKVWDKYAKEALFLDDWCNKAAFISFSPKENWLVVGLKQK
jgi:hypothetical protein